jgi:acyl-coenzyme A synthetase/AMP-(fatty) acid ligase
LAPFYFDLSTFDLFTSLCQGATVNFMPARLTLSPSKLTHWLKENDISTWYTVPSLLSFIALKGGLETTSLPQLKTIMFAGEVFPTPQLIKLTQLLPDVDFYNLYGPTETNVCCYWPIDRKDLNPDTAIPIGIPACGAELKINPATEELQVKSTNNLSGYWQQGQLATRHRQEDFYNTGDKVSINANGEYCYHGRLDRMLKCSGFRVEPAEIERVINNHPGVEQCVIIGINDPTSRQRPAAAIILKQGAELSEINKFIRQQLPAYMQPCKYLQMETIPCLTNGKIDYQAIEQTFSK